MVCAVGVGLALSLTGITSSWADVELGLVLGFTGPIQSMTPGMAKGAEEAVDEVNQSGAFTLGKGVLHRADSTCINKAKAIKNVDDLIDKYNIKTIIGADCSGVTQAIFEKVALPKGILMISPAATSHKKISGFLPNLTI